MKPGAGALTPQEAAVVDALAQADVKRETATLAVVMWSRRHLRPEAELLDLVANYPVLDTLENRNRALRDARGRDWVVAVPSRFEGKAMLKAAADLDTKLARIAPGYAEQIRQIRREETSVRVLGHMGDQEVFDSFATRLGEARSDISMPAVMTSPLSAADVLKARAEAGVKVRILLATADLAGDIRGSNMVGEAKERIDGWNLHAKGRRNFQVRVSRHRDDLRDASSMLVDGSLLRYDVYDDAVERSTEGTMIEVGRSGATNLSRMFQDRFDDAWSRARPLGWWGTIGWALRRWWWLGLVGVGAIIFITMRVEHPTATSLVLGGLIGYLVNKLDPLMKGAKKWWERHRA